MNKLILSGLVATLAAAPAFADEIDYARVVSATPIYHDVRIDTPRQECTTERVVYNQGYQPNPGAVMLGAVLGGVVGHQFGGGMGNAVATGAGALIGANVGARSGGYYGGERVVDRPVCRTYSEYRVEQRLDGYDVAYRYNGRIYHTHTPYDPGNQIAVHVDVAPVQYGPQYGPQYDNYPRYD
ncbi:MAG TPA: hypothetical protein VHE37_03120 [Nevskiaceae bacterium]|nr:hypothetical protein [Nevskiaceae bacterium]